MTDRKVSRIWSSRSTLRYVLRGLRAGWGRPFHSGKIWGHKTHFLERRRSWNAGGLHSWSPASSSLPASSLRVEAGQERSADPDGSEEIRNRYYVPGITRHPKIWTCFDNTNRRPTGCDKSCAPLGATCRDGLQHATKSEDVIPPSLQAGTTQDWVVRTAHVLHCRTQPQAFQAYSMRRWISGSWGEWSLSRSTTTTEGGGIRRWETQRRWTT